MEHAKKSEKASIHERYPLNPDYLNQIVVLGKIHNIFIAQLNLSYIMLSKKVD